jgi:hypothetical protein
MRFAKKTVCLAIVAGTRFVQLFPREALIKSFDRALLSVVEGLRTNGKL